MTTHRILLASMIGIPCFGAMAQLELGPLPDTVWCWGAPLDVPFTASGGFDQGNVFIVELSDVSGAFAPGIPIGSLAGEVPGTVICSNWGAAVPGVGYRLRVRSTSPSFTSAPSGSVLSLAAPNAGSDGALTICSNGPATALFSGLGGSAQPGGIRSDPAATGALVGEQVQPALLPTGTSFFVYTVDDAGCTDDATVFVTLSNAPNAGTNAVITVCSTAPPFPMYQELGSTPDPNGAWTDPMNTMMNGVFDPAVDPSGVFMYTVTGPPPCVSATATLLIQVTQAANAGVDGNSSYCTTDTPFSLLDRLGGNPAPNGTWSYAGMPHGPVFVPGVDGPGEYIHRVLGVAPCGDATASVVLTLVSCAITAPVNMGVQNVAE